MDDIRGTYHDHALIKTITLLAKTPVKCSTKTSELPGLRRRALRKGLWFKILSSVERGLVNLTIKYVKEPRSPMLISALSEIVTRIVEAVKSTYLFVLESIGRPIAAQRVTAALSWGNRQSRDWLNDRAFWRFLALSERNLSWDITSVYKT